MSKMRPLCFECRNLHQGVPGGAPGTCDAFPESIPLDIWENDELHLGDYPGDNGLHFEAIPGQEEKVGILIAMLSAEDDEDHPEPGAGDDAGVHVDP